VKAHVGPVPVQLRFPTPCTSDEYVSRRLWLKATLDACPAHPHGGCSFRRHTPYERKTPTWLMVARWYCPEARCTFSLIPDFLASHARGTLRQIEEAAHAAERGDSLEATAEALRPDIDVQGALRWLRRRVRSFEEAVRAALGAVPALTAVATTPAEVAKALGVDVGDGLTRLRALVSARLPRLVVPFGFLARWRARETAEVDFNNRRARRAGRDPP
jgi:hypothetical protein